MAKEKITITSDVNDTLAESIKSRVINKLGDAFGNKTSNLTKDLRKVFQNLSINYLNNYEEVEKQFNIAAKKLVDGDTNLYKLLEEAAKSTTTAERKDIDIKVKNLLNKYFPAGIKVKGSKIESAAGLLALQQVLKQEKGANFDQFGAIRTIIGEGKDTQKGHSNASIILLSIEAALKNPEINKDTEVVLALEKLRKAARIIDRVEEQELQKAFEKAGIPRSARARKQDFLNIVDELISGAPEVGIDLYVTRDVLASLVEGKVDVKLLVDIQEDAKFNERKGSLSAIVGSLFNELLQNKKITDQIGEELFSKIDAAAITSSPNVYKLISNIIVHSILGKKYKYKSNKKVGTKKSIKLGRTSYKRKKLVNIPKYSKLKTNRKLLEPITFDDIDTFALRNLINGILAENVERQMADSAATDGRLRYQTGRFAESANLLTLTRTQAGILAGQYTYQRYPYDVFLPGHKMGTPKRDPRVYIEGAIRESAMQILQKRFPGISLDLK